MFKKNPEMNNSMAIKVENPVDAKLNVDYQFCQKCHKDRAYCTHVKKETIDNPYTVPLVTSK